MPLVISAVLLLALTGASIYVVFDPTLLEQLLMYAVSLGAWGYVVFVGLLVLAVVCAPVTVMPLTPMASQVFGPFVTGVLCVIGWTLGAVIAFLLSRYAGRPLLERMMSLEKVDAAAAKIPQSNLFWFIVIARHLIPVDVLSFALGLVSTVPFWTYTLATAIGVTWFSFAFAYLGEAFFTGNLWLFTEISLISLAIIVVAWYMLRRRKWQSEQEQEGESFEV